MRNVLRLIPTFNSEVYPLLFWLNKDILRGPILPQP